MAMSLVYPSECRKAVAKLYEPYNLLTVFVEDTSIPNVHINLINRALKGVGSIRSVTPLGGREKVLKEAASDNNCRNFYIVDGDLDLMFGKRYRGKNLYSIMAYCIENLALFEVDVIDILRDYNPRLSPEEIALKLDFGAWEADIEKWLPKLFVIYAIIHNSNVGVCTSKYHISNLYDYKKGCICPRKMKTRYKAMLKCAIDKFGSREFLAIRRSIFDKLAKNKLTWRHYISGKSYLLPIFWQRCLKFGGFKGDEAVLLSRISRTCSLSLDAKYKAVIRKAARRAMKGAGD
jgi:hypothetical protein